MPTRLLAGQIGKPHGLAGDVYVVPISDDPRRFESGSRLLHEDGRTLVVERSREHRTRFLVKFEGIESREDAGSLRGALYVPADDLRALDEDEFWEHDLLGASVTHPDGTPVGTITAVEPGPGQDRFVVATDRGPRYVPVVREIVVEVDPDAGRVVIDPPPGLLD